LLITETELRLIAAAAIMGLSRIPKTGYRIPAATGTGDQLGSGPWRFAWRQTEDPEQRPMNSIAEPSKVLASAATGVVSMIESNHGDVDSIFGSTSIRLQDLDSPIRELSLEQYCRLFTEAARQTGNDNFGLHFGAQFEPKHLGAIGYAAITSPNLVQSIDIPNADADEWALESENSATIPKVVPSGTRRDAAAADTDGDGFIESVLVYAFDNGGITVLVASTLRRCIMALAGLSQVVPVPTDISLVADEFDLTGSPTRRPRRRHERDVLG